MTRPSLPKLPYTEAQRREAADWFAVIHSEYDSSTESSQSWLRWADQDQGNRAAFESIAEAWHATPRSSAPAMPSAEDLLADSYNGDQPVDEWLAIQSAARGMTARSAQHKAHSRTRVRRWAWLAAASLLGVTLGLFTMNRYLDLRGSHSDEFTTKIGEQIHITLADGSRVWLAPK